MNIAIFSFNRSDLLQRPLTALAANDLADKASVTFFCDGPRHEKDEPGTRAVRGLAQKVQDFAFAKVLVEISARCIWGCLILIVRRAGSYPARLSNDSCATPCCYSCWVTE